MSNDPRDSIETGVQAVSVACNHCGAPLEVGPGTRFVTCAHCGSQLEVHRTGSSLYTEVLQSIDRRTSEMAEDLDTIKRQNEVERLDREWMMRREQYYSRNKDGSTSPPSAIGGVIGAIMAVVFGFIWIGFASSDRAPAPLIGFGVLFIVAGVVSALVAIGKAARYQDARRSYEQQRDQLLRGERFR